MPTIGKSREQVHKMIYGLGILSTSSQRDAVEECVMQLSRREQWYPGQLRTALKELEAQGVLTKEKRYKLQDALFADDE